MASFRAALAIDYPALKHFLGAEEFTRLVARYVEGAVPGIFGWLAARP